MAYCEEFMSKAIALAEQASRSDEVPVAAVLVKDGKVIACATNEKEKNKNSLAHAEMIAMTLGAEKLGDWRLDECELYCTLEPCPMCAGAMINSRLKTLYYGAHDHRFGAAGSQIDLLDGSVFNHKVTVYGGCRERECAEMLSDFFEKKRK